jgi:nucleotide-binding universal stress UspA family protein
MILICYDGSDAAKSGISQAAHLMPGHPATVLTVWEPRLLLLESLTEVATRRRDDQASEIARLCAEQGTALAHEAGIDALAESVADHSSVAGAILGVAAELDADAIIVGCRHQRGVISHVRGSVSHTLMQLVSRPLLVVPARVVADRHHRKFAVEEPVR